MPVYLSLLVCTLIGDVCHVAVPIEEPFIGMSACQVAGMMMLPRWLEQHPGWLVRRIRCSVGGRPRADEAV